MQRNQLERRRFLATGAGGLLSAAGLPTAWAIGKESRKIGLRAGASAVCITPELGVSLKGYFMDNGPVVAIHDDLFTRALVLDDGRQRIALLICDVTVIPGPVFDRAKRLIEQRSGIPGDRIMMSSTHTHSAPRVGVADGKKDLEYVDRLVKAMADAVALAVKNLAPAKIGSGSGSKPEYLFNRRWYMKPGSIPADPFGGTTDRVRFNPPRGSKDLLEPSGPTDPEVSVLSVQHADGRPMAVLANYGIHYAGGFKSGEVSADYFGVFARRLAELLPSEDARRPLIGMMSNGTSGNIGSGKSFREPGARLPNYEHMRLVGNALAEEVSRVVEGIEHREPAGLAMIEKTVDVGVRRPDAARLDWANRILAEPEKKYPHRWTVKYAHEALHLSRRPAIVPVRLQAIRIGDTLIGTIPNEVFSETGLAVKRASPNEQTFVIELANQYYGYLPTPEHHALGGYETWAARSSALEVQAETKIRRTLIELIRRVADASSNGVEEHAEDVQGMDGSLRIAGLG